MYSWSSFQNHREHINRHAGCLATIRLNAVRAQLRLAHQFFPQPLARLLQCEVGIGRQYVPNAALDLRTELITLPNDQAGDEARVFQVGLDYVGTKPVLFGGRLVGGVDYRSLEATDWRGGVSAKVGLEFGRPRPERRGLTVLLEYFDGSAPFGQFYRDVVTYYGVGVQFDY